MTNVDAPKVQVFEDRELYVWQKGKRSTLIEVVQVGTDSNGTKFQIWMNGKLGFAGMQFSEAVLDARLAFFARVDALRPLEVEDVELVDEKWLYHDTVDVIEVEDEA